MMPNEVITGTSNLLVNCFRRVGAADDEWGFTDEYWNARKVPGFVNLQIEPLW